MDIVQDTGSQGIDSSYLLILLLFLPRQLLIFFFFSFIFPVLFLSHSSSPSSLSPTDALREAFFSS